MTGRRIAWGVWGLTVALTVAWPLLAEAAQQQDSELLAYAIGITAVIGYATVGALIASRRSGNRVGWILAWIGLAAVVGLAAGAYAKLAIDGGGALPFGRWAAWLGRTGFPLMFVPIPLIFFLFPTGHVAGRKWRPVLWVYLAAAGVNVLLFALTPGMVNAGFTELVSPVTNPLGLPRAWTDAVEGVTEIAGFAAFGCSFLGVISLFLRYRRAGGEERQQIRWLAYVAGVAAAIPLAGFAVAGIRALAGIRVGEDDTLGDAMFLVFFVLLLVGVPVACAIAILRYRLYDLDIVVKKTVVFAVVATSLTLVYGLLVLLIPVSLFGLGGGESFNVPLLLTALAVAVLFNPVRSRARRLADRLVYGKRASPYEVLSDFSDRLADSYSTEDVLPRMASLLAASTGAAEARVWLRIGAELVPVASWPGDAPRAAAVSMPVEELPPMDGDAFPVRHQGEILGAVSLRTTANDPMNPTKAKLVRGVAGQAGLVLRNVRLIEELRASRRRIVEAQDERAKKLERDLHDGAQQQLVALTVQLRLAEQMVGRDPDKERELLRRLQSSANGALEDLRDLARGIYPPLLADQGLQAALEAQARKSSVPVVVETDAVGRYAREVESAVYFCALEALTNVAKYADASGVVLRVAHSDGHLTFSVADDGRGFDTEARGRGTGLQGMADRLEAIGGTFRVASVPGEGTTVTGRVPVGGSG